MAVCLIFFYVKKGLLSYNILSEKEYNDTVFGFGILE